MSEITGCKPSKDAGRDIRVLSSSTPTKFNARGRRSKTPVVGAFDLVIQRFGQYAGAFTNSYSSLYLARHSLTERFTIPDSPVFESERGTLR